MGCNCCQKSDMKPIDEVLQKYKDVEGSLITIL